MTVQGTTVLILFGVGLVLWLLDLVRRDRLYVGYGVVFIVSVFGVILILVIPGVLSIVTRLVGTIFPASALTLLALGFIVLMLIYVLTQVTIVSNRLALLVQEIAIQQAKEAHRSDVKQGTHGTDRA